MSTKIKMVFAVALLTAAAAPGISFAQEAEFLPDQYTSSHCGVTNIPADAYGSAVAPVRHRVPQSAVPRQPNCGAFGGAYGAVPEYSPRERVYAPNRYQPTDPFSGGVNSDFQMQRSG